MRLRSDSWERKAKSGKTVAANLGKGFLIAFFIWIVLPLGLYIFLMGGLEPRTLEDQTAYTEAGGEQMMRARIHMVISLRFTRKKFRLSLRFPR